MARPPVAKLMDYGKFKYESALKARESRKNQAQTVIKEIKLRPKIDPHDYGTKKGHVERFLKQGDKVKVTIMFRGREQSRPELGFKLLQRLAGDIEELGFVESSPKQDGRNMIMVLGPHKRKTEAMAAAKADRASRSSARNAEQAGGADEAETETEAQTSAPQAVSPAPAPAEPASAPESTSTPAAARPAAPAAPARSTATPRPAAPRATPAATPRPGPASNGAPKPTAPRGSSAASRPSAAAAPKPGPARRTSDGPVPGPRATADRGAPATESGETER
jgi:translation initiation factor IF-3